MCGGMAGDVWYAPAGKSFMAGIMKDAGMNYIYRNTDGTASISLSLEQVFNDDHNDFWKDAVKSLGQKYAHIANFPENPQWN